jgi:hypothetical protein
MSDNYAPKPEHKFTFGQWKVGSIERAAIASRGLKYERLDQLTINLLLGAR